jgi:hypothetical protein
MREELEVFKKGWDKKNKRDRKIEVISVRKMNGALRRLMDWIILLP